MITIIKTKNFISGVGKIIVGSTGRCVLSYELICLTNFGPPWVGGGGGGGGGVGGLENVSLHPCISVSKAKGDNCISL